MIAVDLTKQDPVAPLWLTLAADAMEKRREELDEKERKEKEKLAKEEAELGVKLKEALLAILGTDATAELLGDNLTPPAKNEVRSGIYTFSYGGTYRDYYNAIKPELMLRRDGSPEAVQYLGVEPEYNWIGRGHIRNLVDLASARDELASEYLRQLQNADLVKNRRQVDPANQLDPNTKQAVYWMESLIETLKSQDYYEGKRFLSAEQELVLSTIRYVRFHEPQRDQDY